MNKKKVKRALHDAWHFIWEDDSIWSWLVNVVLAFVLIKFIVYPGLGFLLSTSHPIVAVVSGSMHHTDNFDTWWDHSARWYTANNITKEDFSEFKFRNGFSRGDIMVLMGAEPKDIKIGDIIVFISHRSRPRSDPIIHRVVKRWEENGKIYYQTKGDNYKTNSNQINICDDLGCIDETKITSQQVIGKAALKVPYLGYVKIGAVELVCLFNDFNFCIR